jgi:uncharacterized membrane protein
MGHFTLKTHFEAPIETLFTVGLDPFRIPEYMPWVSDIRDVHGQPDQVESRFTFTDSYLGQKVEGTVEVLAVQSPTMYETLTKYANGMQVRWTDRLTKVEGGTDVLTEIDYEIGPGIVRAVADRIFLEKVIERRVRHAFEHFKHLVEAETRQPVSA